MKAKPNININISALVNTALVIVLVPLLSVCLCGKSRRSRTRAINCMNLCVLRGRACIFKFILIRRKDKKEGRLRLGKSGVCQQLTTVISVISNSPLKNTHEFHVQCEKREREGGETHHYHSANIHHPENDDDDDDDGDADFGSGDDICQLINKMWDTLQQQQKNQLCVLVVIPHKQGQTSLPTLAHSSPELPTHTRANWVNDIKIGRTHTQHFAANVLPFCLLPSAKEDGLESAK